MPPGAFLVFFVFFFVVVSCPRPPLGQNNSCRQTLFVQRLFARIFMKVGVENYRRFNGMKIPSMKARTKVLASFEAGMNLPNLPWHVNITSLKHKR